MSCFHKVLKNRKGQKKFRDAPKMHVVFLKKDYCLWLAVFSSASLILEGSTLNYFSLLRNRKKSFWKKTNILGCPNKRFVWTLNPRITQFSPFWPNIVFSVWIYSILSRIFIFSFDFFSMKADVRKTCPYCFWPFCTFKA